MGGRSVLKAVLTNFIKSLSPKKALKGTVVGKDHLGNTYFEISADPSVGKRKPSRWFNTHGKEVFDQEVPIEWEAWLRGRRSVPPTEAEIKQNLDLAAYKKLKGDEFEARDNKFSEKRKLQSGEDTHPSGKLDSFPKYKEFSTDPSITSLKK